MPEKQGKVHREKEIVLLVSTAKEEFVVMMESLILGSTLQNTSRKINVKRRRIAHTYTHKRRVDLSAQKKKELTVAIVNSANYRPMTTSEKLLQFEPAMNSHLKAEGKLEQIRRSKMPMKGIMAFERNFRLKREASNSHTRVWREQDSERNFHLWT